MDHAHILRVSKIKNRDSYYLNTNSSVSEILYVLIQHIMFLKKLFYIFYNILMVFLLKKD